MDFDSEVIGNDLGEELFEVAELKENGMQNDERGGENEEENGVKKEEPNSKKERKNSGHPLNEKILTSTKGLSALVKIFEDVTFQGKDEEENLNKLILQFEYWAHQMYPRSPFEDVIEKVEILGNKKAVRMHAHLLKTGVNDQMREIEDHDQDQNEKE